jgi:2-polyprenyl-6-methoxyphenol hydroxylase-like FAD-dependent oxidoreductase
MLLVVVTATSIIEAAAHSTNEQLPVLIVGAGPCGLVAATTFLKHNIPFVIIEKASRKKVCSNAGSGFELASTAIGILKDRLSIDTSKIMSLYVGMTLMTIGGMNIRNVRMPEKVMLASVNRAEMQKYLLDEILFPGIGSEKKKKENGALICGYSIDSYTEEGGDEDDGRVVATLVSDDGEKKTITGCALLACDGINSRCRAVMHGSSNDPLQFCNAIFYWGKTPVPEGSELEKEVLKTQKHHKDGCSFVFTIPTSKIPGGLFVAPTKNFKVLVWAVTVRTNDLPTSNISTKTNNDSTRRGGGVLTEEGKERLFPSSGSSTLLGIGNNLPILRKIIENTPANDITEACLFDRENLDLPFSSQKKRVALLGGK